MAMLSGYEKSHLLIAFACQLRKSIKKTDLYRKQLTANEQHIRLSIHGLNAVTHVFEKMYGKYYVDVTQF
jgi:hypothetical protein